MIYFCLLLSLSITSAQPTGQLLTDRMSNAEIYINKVNSIGQLLYAYNTAASGDIFHTIRDVGDFGPGILALEYDEILFIIEQFLGYNPVTLTSKWDPYTTSWIDDGNGDFLLKIGYTINITTFNTTTGSYNTKQEGFRYTNYMIFENTTSALIKLAYDIQDPAAVNLLMTESTTVSDPVSLCAGLIYPACNGTYGPSYIADTGYTSLEDCIAFLTPRTMPSKCPFQTRSDTNYCRSLHAVSSFIRPDIHCQHTGKSSVTCVDSCLSTCNNCDPNAKCVATFPTLFTPIYKCQCNDGYKGNGTVCIPEKCDKHGHCNIDPGKYVCSAGLCKCTDTFTWNPLYKKKNDKCLCEDEGNIWLNGTSKMCVPLGRCLEDKHCINQKQNTVKCLSVGYNTFTSWGGCLCNYGYEGGWESDCVCPDPKREVYSNVTKGKVCLSATECVSNRNCKPRQHCSLTHGNPIGTCIL
jgi:hypothetical protein